MTPEELAEYITEIRNLIAQLIGAVNRLEEAAAAPDDAA